jgi:hypothetical protein
MLAHLKGAVPFTVALLTFLCFAEAAVSQEPQAPPAPSPPPAGQVEPTPPPVAQPPVTQPPVAQPPVAQPQGTAPQGAAPQGTPPPAAPAEQPQPAQPKTETPTITLDTQEVQGILGKEALSRTGEKMGQIVDVIIDRTGTVRAAIIDFGGFLGVGSRKIAVDWRAVHFVSGGKAIRIILDLTREDVVGSPEYKPNEHITVLEPKSAPAVQENLEPKPVPAAPEK